MCHPGGQCCLWSPCSTPTTKTHGGLCPSEESAATTSASHQHVPVRNGLRLSVWTVMELGQKWGHRRPRTQRCQAGGSAPRPSAGPCVPSLPLPWPSFLSIGFILLHQLAATLTHFVQTLRTEEGRAVRKVPSRVLWKTGAGTAGRFFQTALVHALASRSDFSLGTQTLSRMTCDVCRSQPSVFSSSGSWSHPMQLL